MIDLRFMKDIRFRSMFICLMLDALYEGGRMFIGATSAVYLLANGCSLAQLAYLKLIQGFVFLLAEVPTGSFADLHGRKKSLMISGALGILGFLLYFSGSQFEIFAVAEICTALSLCFWSGAYEAYCVDYAALDSEAGLLDRFFHLNQALVSTSILICGLLGSFLAEIRLSLGYLAGAAAFGACLLVLLQLPENQHAANSVSGTLERTQNLLRSSRDTILDSAKHPALIPLILASLAVQFSIQPLLHYWQPFFEAVHPDLPTAGLGLVFSVYTAVSAALGFLYARYTHLKFFRSSLGTIVIFAVFSFFYLLLAQSHTWGVALTMFACTQGALALGRTSLMARINEQSSSEKRARVVSSVSLFSRFGMMGALFFIPILVHNQQMTPANTPAIYLTFSVISVAAVSLILVSFLIPIQRMKA